MDIFSAPAGYEWLVAPTVSAPVGIARKPATYATSRKWFWRVVLANGFLISTSTERDARALRRKELNA